MAPKKVTPRGKAAKPPTQKKPPAKKAAKKTTRSRSASTSKKVFIRSLVGAAGGVRLSFDEDYKLTPRGQIGDIVQVTEDDRLTPSYQADLNVLFHEISEEEAREAISKQATNAQAPRQPALMDIIKNERGESYAQAEPQVEVPFEQQGEVVATISDGPDGRFTDGYQGTITRSGGEAPQQVAAPGSVQNPLPEVPSDVPPEQVADWVARNTKSEQTAADAVRNSLRVTGP